MAPSDPHLPVFMPPCRLFLLWIMLVCVTECRRNGVWLSGLHQKGHNSALLWESSSLAMGTLKHLRERPTWRVTGGSCQQPGRSCQPREWPTLGTDPTVHVKDLPGKPSDDCCPDDFNCNLTRDLQREPPSQAAPERLTHMWSHLRYWNWKCNT